MIPNMDISRASRTVSTGQCPARVSMRRWHVDILRPSRHATYRTLTPDTSYTSQGSPDVEMAGRGRLQVSHASNQPLTETLNSSTTAREELDAAIARVCERINVPIEDARTQVQLLEAVMPDFLPNISAMLASRQRWQQIAADVASLDISSVDSQEAELLQAIMAAIQAAERDSEETLLHNEITRAVCQVFGEYRVMGCIRKEVAGDAQQALERYLGVQQQKLRQLLEQQVEAAVTCADLMGRLLALHTALPTANISAMVARSPAVLQLLPEQIETAVQEARDLLSAELGDEVDALLVQAPYLLQPGVLSAVLQDLGATFPGMSAAYMLQQHVKLGSVHLAGYSGQQGGQ